MYKFIVPLLYLLVLTHAQVPGFGRCPTVIVEQNFNPSFYLGKWYEQARYPNTFEGDGKCVTATYNPGTNGTVNVVNTMIRPSNEEQISTNGTANLSSPTGEGKLDVRIATSPLPFPAPYWILDTDYYSYSVVYACADLFFFHFKYVWVLTRSRFPMPQTMASAYSVLEANKIDSKNTTLLPVNQALCPTYW